MWMGTRLPSFPTPRTTSPPPCVPGAWHPPHRLTCQLLADPYITFSGRFPHHLLSAAHPPSHTASCHLIPSSQRFSLTPLLQDPLGTCVVSAVPTGMQALGADALSRSALPSMPSMVPPLVCKRKHHHLQRSPFPAVCQVRLLIPSRIARWHDSEALARLHAAGTGKTRDTVLPTEWPHPDRSL